MAGREGKRRLLRRRSSSFHNVALLLVLPVGGLLIFFAVMFVRSAMRSPVLRLQPSHIQATVVLKPVALAPRRRQSEIVLILDDVGFDHQPLPAAMAIDPNINFSVLPNAPHGV